MIRKKIVKTILGHKGKISGDFLMFANFSFLRINKNIEFAAINAKYAPPEKVNNTASITVK